MDIDYLLWLQGMREGSGPVVQAFFAFLGSEAATVVLALVPCFVYWCLDKERGVLSLFAYSSSWVFNQLIKNTVCCYRPWVRNPRVTPVPSAREGATGYSFPSTHSQSAAAVLMSIGWSWRERVWPLVACATVTLLVGFSRNFLGVHAPQDVLVGMAEGCLFVWVALRLLSWVNEDEGRELRFMAISSLVMVLFLAYVTLKPYPMDYVGGQLLVDPREMMVDCYKAVGGAWGILVGWFVERHWIRFDEHATSLSERVLRMVVGLALVLLVHVPIGHALVGLAGPLAGQLVRHLLVFLMATAIVPMTFAPMRRVLQRR